MLKICNKCKIEKNLDDFFFRNKKKGYKSPYCKECFMIINNRYKKQNPQIAKNIKKKEYKTNSENYRNKNLKRYYGISLQDYETMLLSQDGKCAICESSKTTRKNNRLDVDHCHKTGKVRKLLCSKCNRLLSNCQENTDILQKAIRYLKENDANKFFQE